MTHTTTIIATVSAILALTITISLAGSNYASAAHAGFITPVGPYIKVADPTTSSVVPIITNGDTVGAFTYSKIPDGIGFIKGKADQINVFMNHELDGTEGVGSAKVSRLEIDRNTLNVMDAKYVIDGPSDGSSYKRFCSANMAKEGSFRQNPVFFTGEEDASSGHGKVVAVDAKTNAKTELPWMGYFAHENTIDVPYFARGGDDNDDHEKHDDHDHKHANKTVLLSFEDGPAGNSEIYMYIANTASDALSGNGQLYVFKAVDDATYKNWSNIYYANGTISGKFVPITWDYHTQDATALQTTATNAKAFEFIRAEDGTMDVRNGFENVLYVADTGNNSVLGGPVTSHGVEFKHGRIYKFTFTNPADPTDVKLQVLLDGGDSTAPGFGMKNPDNLGTSQNSLMVLEDRNGYNRPAVVGSFDITQSGKVWQYDLGAGSFAPVAYVDQSYDTTNPPYGEWESSGVVDASSVFGKGTWLIDVQAHSLHEGGQLLLLKVKNS